MSAQALTYNTPPEKLLQLLQDRLPTSLPLLRRLQFTKFPSGTTSHARIVFASESNSLEDVSRTGSFTATWFDLSNGPDTQMWLYSTLEDDTVTGIEESEYERQLTSVVNEIIRLKKEYEKDTYYPGCILLGTLHSRVRQLLERSGRVQPRVTGNYDKWLFRLENLPVAEVPLPEGMFWDTATLEDCHLVVSRTDIPRRAYAMSPKRRLIGPLTHSAKCWQSYRTSP